MLNIPSFSPFRILLAILIAVGMTSGSNAFADEAANHHPKSNHGGDEREGAQDAIHVMWLNHYALLPGDDSVQVTYNSTSSGVGGGLSALVVHSTTLGDWGNSGGIKVVEMAVQVPPRHDIVGVRVCYELTSANSFISQIRLAQVQNPPAFAYVLLDDGTDLVAVGPACIDSQATMIDPEAGPVLLDLRVNFGSVSDRIAIRGVGLRLKPKD